MKLFFKAFILTFILNSLIFNAFAADPVSVLVDGKKINYELVEPIIVNDRTMVPIRETAEYLGMTFVWDDATKTMTFTNGLTEVVHTLNQSVIYVNKLGKFYDTPSMVVNDRNLMPIRMLGDAIGAVVDWNAATRSVVISTTGGSTGGTTGGTTGSSLPAGTEQPQIVSLSPGAKEVAIGENVEVRVVANTGTTSVKITDKSQNELATSTNYTLFGIYHLFDMSFKYPDVDEDSQTFNVYAGSLTGFAATTDKSFTVDSKSSGIEITKVSPSATKMDVNKTVDVEVRTQTGVTEVWIEDPSKNTVAETTSSKKTDGELVWTLSFKAKKSGSYVVYAADDDNNQSSEKMTLTVSGTLSDFAINDISGDLDVDYNDTVKLTILTETGAEEVWIEDSSGNEIASTSSYKKSGSEYSWTLSFTAKKSGTYYVYSTDGYDDERQSIKLTVDGSSSSSSGYAEINDVDVDPSGTIYTGEWVDLEIYTNKDVVYVYVENKYGDVVDSTSSYSTSGSERVWYLDFDAYYSGKYIIYAEDDYGDYDTYSITVKD